MHANQELLERFYQAFSRRDGEAMAAAYAPTATFRDPVFPDLIGEEVGRMWKMLCERGKDLVVEPSNIVADEDKGSADWRATYSFSATGRRVVNIVHARFRFQEGLIVEHVDSFDFYRWTRMALGPLGLVLGWTPLVQNKIRQQARAGLEAYQG